MLERFITHIGYEAGLVTMQELNDGEPLSVLTDAVRSGLMKNITRRMTPQPLKIRADVDMTCFAYDGGLHIQASTSGCTEIRSLTSCMLYMLCQA